MSGRHKGHRVPISSARNIVIDQLHYARQAPAIAVTRAMRLPPVVAARNAASPAPSWTALFMRAYGLVAQRYPELRRAWIRWPWPHFYEHPHSVCVLVTERESAGEDLLLLARLPDPEHMSLTAIDRRIHHFKHAPLHEVDDFRRMLRYARLPWPLRRLMAWLHLSCSGYFKAKRLGNFVISSLGSLNVDIVNPLCLLTTHLAPGPVSANGDVVINLAFDHRVTDGRPIARALNDLEIILNTTIVEELHALRRRAA